LFLELWERAPTPGPAAALRVQQIRRANPELAAAIRHEIGNVPAEDHACGAKQRAKTRSH
ncbi:MAG TPA: hypothetical protein VNC39_16175, partial [Acidocella sp.]|uniref:hypothetical protein n=1 Tax=Acidocella sp. TaxID=50710 RepID=UPI002CC801A5